MTAETSFPSLSPGILFAPTSDGGVVYDVVEEQLSFLNVSAAAVCHACDEQLDRAEALRTWADATGIDPARLGADVDRALVDFAAAGMTGRTTPPPRTYPPDAPVTPLAAGDAATVQAAGIHRIRFRSRGAAAIESVRGALGMEEPVAHPTAEFTVVMDEEGGVRLVTDTEWHFGDLRAMTSTLVSVVNDFVARTDTEVVLHAGAVQAPDGTIVVLPAPPGCGKSTLVGALIQQGWSYLSDESATVRRDDLAVVGYAKPLSLDPTSLTALRLSPDLGPEVLPDAVASGVRVRNKPTAAPGAIVIPRFVGDDGVAEQATLTGQEALTALVGNTLNLRYVGARGLETLVALCEQVPVHTIAYRSTAEAVAQLAALGPA